MKTTGLPWKALNGVWVLGLLLFPANLGAHPSRLEAECATQVVRLTLANEQIQFCAPTSLPFTAIEDNLTIPQVAYAGLNQLDGYATFNIRAALPGAQPGPGMPVYMAGQVDAYRQAAHDLAASSSGRVTNADSADLWGEKVPGFQTDDTLPSPQKDRHFHTVEWEVEHNGRLWVFSLAWDTAIRNAGEWREATNHLVIERSTANLPDTAIDLGRTDSSAPSGLSRETMGGDPVDKGLPAWWEGDICDDGDYFENTGVHAVPLGLPWHGVYACGTNPLSAMVNYWVQFYPGAWGQVEWQCVELANRFLYLEWGIPPVQGNAREMKDNLPASMVFYANDGAHPMVPGDILIDDGKNASDSGHAMVITGTHFDGTGEQFVDILEQNSSPAGSRSIHITDGIVDNDAWAWGRPVQGWLHVKANTAAGDADPTFSLAGTDLNGPVTALGLQSTGKIIVGGEFTSYNGTTRNHLARLNADGSLDLAFDPVEGVSIASGTPQVFALTLLADDTILLGGQFNKYGTTARANLVRLTSNGAADLTFTPPAAMAAVTGTPSINAIAVQSDGKVIIGGNFNDLDGGVNDFIARLNSAGLVDSLFTAATSNIVHALVVQSDGRILVGGEFAGGLLRLNSDGTVDPTFNPAPATGANAIVNSIALQEDKIYIAGTFTTYNGIARSGIARLNSSGALDTTFNPGTGIGGTSAGLQTVLPQPDGRILIGGNFATYNSAPAYNFLRLNNDGTRDNTFMPRGEIASPDAGNYVQPILLQPDSKIILGGQFTGFITRLLNEILPCYSLTTQASPLSGGSITVNPGTNCPGGKYISGSMVQLTALPNTAQEFIFTNWNGGASGASNPLSVTMTGSKSITANFLDPPHAFNKLSPINGAADVPFLVNFSWSSSAGAASYELCLDANNSGVCGDDNTPSAWSTVGAGLNAWIVVPLPSNLYHWNVRARNQAGTTHSGLAWSLTRDTSDPLQFYFPLIRR
jgi:uncharacterized delta-60 repeat protein